MSFLTLSTQLLGFTIWYLFRYAFSIIIISVPYTHDKNPNDASIIIYCLCDYYDIIKTIFQPSDSIRRILVPSMSTRGHLGSAVIVVCALTPSYQQMRSQKDFYLILLEHYDIGVLEGLCNILKLNYNHILQMFCQHCCYDKSKIVL